MTCLIAPHTLDYFITEYEQKKAELMEVITKNNWRFAPAQAAARARFLGYTFKKEVKR